MKVFLNGIPVDEYPAFIRRPGELFTRLVGINVSSDGNCEPQYIPFVRFHRCPGQILIEINSTRPVAYITLQKRKPIFHVFYFPWWLLDKDEL